MGASGSEGKLELDVVPALSVRVVAALLVVVSEPVSSSADGEAE